MTEIQTRIPSDVLRRCAAELTACVVQYLFPTALLVGGESTETGFSYDFIFSQVPDQQMLPVIEQEMAALIKQDPPIKSTQMMRQNGVAFLEHIDKPLRAEQLSSFSESLADFIQIGEFSDFCAGPHLSSLKPLRAFRLLRLEPIKLSLPVSGEIAATRICGVVFQEKDELKRFLKRVEDAKKQDHQRLGKEMNLFSTSEIGGVGGWFWHPNGMKIREILLNWWRQEINILGYQEIATPRLLKNFYTKDSTSVPSARIAGEGYQFVQSLAPAHALFFAKKEHTFQELPFRSTESADLFLGEYNNRGCGMFRSSVAHVPEAYSFCTPQQVIEELISSLQFINRTIRMFGFEYRWNLTGHSSCVPAKKRGLWSQGSQWLSKAFEAAGCAYTTQEEGVAYLELSLAGPRMELYLTDALGREWRGPWIQINTDLPERLGLRYERSEGIKDVPIMVGHSIYGPLERFIALLVEHFGGCFPLWLTPEQVRVISIKERNVSYAEEVYVECQKRKLRVSADKRSVPLAEKIYVAEREQVPYIIIVGDQEEKKREVTVRHCRDTGKKGHVQLGQFLEQLQIEIVSSGLSFNY